MISKEEVPCGYVLGSCPYGTEIEKYPLQGMQISDIVPKAGAVSCYLFGHDCPACYESDDIVEFRKRSEIVLGRVQVWMDRHFPCPYCGGRIISIRVRTSLENKECEVISECESCEKAGRGWYKETGEPIGEGIYREKMCRVFDIKEREEED